MNTKILSVIIFSIIALETIGQNNTQKLFLALQNNSVSLHVIDSLVRKGAKINAVCKIGGWQYGLTPVMMAAAHHRLDIFQYLEKRGAGIYEKTKLEKPDNHVWPEFHYNCNAFQIAVFYFNGQTDSLLNYLFTKKYNVNEYCNQKIAPLQYAITGPQCTFLSIKYLIENGISIPETNTDNTNESILYYSTFLNKKHRKNTAEFLIKHGAKASVSENYLKWDLLSHTIYFHVNDIAKLLVEYKLCDPFEKKNLYIKDSDNKTINLKNDLNLALYCRNYEMIQFLVDYGFDKKDITEAWKLIPDLKNDPVINFLLKNDELPPQELSWIDITNDSTYADIDFLYNRAKMQFEAELYNGQKVSDATYSGKVVLLFFATDFSAETTQQLKLIQKLKQLIKNERFQVIVTTIAPKISDISSNNFMNAYSNTFDIIFDPGWQFLKTYRTKTPGAFILDKNTVAVAEIIGAKSWDENRFVELIEVLINR